MDKFKLYLIYVFIISSLFFLQIGINENKVDKKVGVATINLYENKNLLDVNNFVQIVPEDFTFTTPAENKTNISVVKSKSLLDNQVSNDSVVLAQEYIDENLSELTQGYEINIDNNTYYTDTVDNITWVKNQIIKLITPNEEVAQELIDTGSFTPYQDGDKKITKITLDNEITVNETMVPKKQMITDEKKLLNQILFAFEEVQYDTIGDETIEEFAERNNISVETLKMNNASLENNELFYTGQEFIINNYKSPLKPAYYYEQTIPEVINYSTEIIQDDTMNVGQEEVIIEGVDGMQEVTYEAKEVDGELQYYNVLDNNVTENPVVEVKRVGTHIVDGLGTGTFIWPSDSHKISCDYYCYSGHGGVDIQNYYGAPIFAADNGTVTYSGCTSGGYGCHVILDHNNGYVTLYGHMSETSAVVGTNVAQGEVIGYEGNTGNVQGANGGIHIHFEIRKDGAQTDPLTYF